MINIHTYIYINDDYFSIIYILISLKFGYIFLRNIIHLKIIYKMNRFIGRIHFTVI